MYGGMESFDLDKYGSNFYEWRYCAIATSRSPVIVVWLLPTTPSGYYLPHPHVITNHTRRFISKSNGVFLISMVTKVKNKSILTAYTWSPLQKK